MDKSQVVKTIDLRLHDTKRNRDVPILFYLPNGDKPAPVVFFSHGLGGARTGNEFLGVHLAKRGYVAVFLQHPGSDDSVWRGAPLRDRLASMKKAASAQNLSLRIADVSFVIDELANLNGDLGKGIAGRMDLKRIGMSGHSFGAVTSEAVSGESFPGVGQSLTDSRIKAAIMYSPSTPKSADPAKAFGNVKLPWLLMTGTKDQSPINDTDVANRLSVFPALPVGDKFELVLENAEHSAFTDRALPGDREPRNPNHHRAILGISTAFWDAYLKQDKAAAKWLKGDGPKSILEPKDRWQKK
ncbi:MAG: hypothetical protein IT203_05750 [Fimbriimonadaceae bacterium]|nr:hypothetical protein [Fimbriimonadaceae bacterium]